MPKPSTSRTACVRHSFLALLLASSAITGCVGHVVRPSARGTLETAQDLAKPRDLFVFLDGTRNDVGTETNVWRLYQLVNMHGSQSTRSIYIEGVGSALHPLTGTLLGLGMERRIRIGYEFLADNYRPGDRIYLFGFSRGAHEARALAGILSFAGLPQRENGELPGAFSRKINRIVGIVKGITDSDAEWSRALAEPGSETSRPALAAPQVAERFQGLRMLAVPIQFVGVWDTVPGSFFKKFDTCSEKVKKSSSGIERPTRYKTRSYPTIRHIAHAVAIDEKRSRFAPLFVCEPMRKEMTRVREVWFPGAHSDVGGGYSDAMNPDSGPPLSNRSLNWMLRELSEEYTFDTPVVPLPENPLAIAHWSIGDSPGNWFSKCEDRVPQCSDVDASYFDRLREPNAPLKRKKSTRGEVYPQFCPEAPHKFRCEERGASTPDH